MTIKSGWEVIPHEIFSLVFEYLSFQLKHRYLNVCRLWYQLLVPLAQQQLETILYEELELPYHWRTTHTIHGSTWEWTYPDDYMIIDSKNIHTHEIKTSAIFKLDHYATKMMEKEFVDLQNLEDMVMIDGINKRFCPSKPLFILTEEFESIIENCKIQDEGYEYECCSYVTLSTRS